MVNVSEGRDRSVIEAVSAAAGRVLLDRHVDHGHHRTVLTLAGDPGDVEDAVRAVAAEAVGRIDLTTHRGAHPRLGALDVVPFVALRPGGRGRLADGDLGTAARARDAFAQWLGAAHGVPCFLYGPLPDGTTRTLPDVRRHAFDGLEPDTGPSRPHPTAGATAVGARPLLVAYNLWLTSDDVALARELAAGLRRPGVRSLGLLVDGTAQVSCNLTDPLVTGPAWIHDEVAAALAARGERAEGTAIARAELVGLVPAAVVDAVAPARRALLDLSEERTLEARLGVAP